MALCLAPEASANTGNAHTGRASTVEISNQPDGSLNAPDGVSQQPVTPPGPAPGSEAGAGETLELHQQGIAHMAPSSVSDPSGSFDATLVDAFGRSAKDRAMLMRADTEMETFMRDINSQRLPIQPPHFAPLNSFQRLLIHRLADSFGLQRILEPVALPGVPGAPLSILVLQKTPQSLIPAVRLSDLDRHFNALAAAQIRQAEEQQAQRAAALQKVPAKSDAIEQPLLPISVDHSPPLAEDGIVSPAPLLNANFRIMTRQPGSDPTRPRSSASADDPTQAGKRALTLEEREAAYAEARQRIFASGIEGESDACDRIEMLTTASCPETPLMRPKTLRPSAPVFDPTIYAPVASTSQAPLLGTGADFTALVSHSQPVQSWADERPASPTSTSQSGFHRSGSRSPSSASVSTIASSKTSTSTSSSVSDPVSRTSRSTSSRRISANQPVMRFGPSTGTAPPLFPPQHPLRPASPSPSAASVSTNSSRRSGGSRSFRLGPGLPDLEPMSGNPRQRKKDRPRTPSPPSPPQPLHPSLPVKPIWSKGTKKTESEQNNVLQPKQEAVSSTPATTIAFTRPVQTPTIPPLPPDALRLHAAAEYFNAASLPTPHAAAAAYFAAPNMMPTGYYAIPESQQLLTAPMWDPYMAALYQQNLENMMGQLRLAPAQNGDVPVIQLDEDSPRAARPPSMSLYDPEGDSGSRVRVRSPV